MVRVFGDADCRNSRRALEWLQRRNFSYQFSDLRKGGLPPRALNACIDAYGWRALIDGRTVAWRALAEHDVRDLDQAGAQALITELPQLLKCPIFGVGDSWLLGWNAANKVRLLGQIPLRGFTSDTRGQAALARH